MRAPASRPSAAARRWPKRLDLGPAGTVRLSSSVAQWGLGEFSAAQLAFLLIAAFTLFRLVSAALVGPGVDEAYTLAIARQIQLSYFDHPPLQVWGIHLFSGVLGYGRLARLPFVALFAVSSWLM